MLPHIGHFESIERIRDGGSLAASWRNTGVNYWLFFKIMRDQKNGDHTGFESPVILNRLSGLTEKITWDYFEKVLSIISKETITETDFSILNQMKIVAKNDGNICKITKYSL